MVKAVALPIEHGAWGFLLEPVLLGLMLAPSAAGFALGLAALFAFLARHPLKLVLSDWRRDVDTPRTSLAEAFAFAYATAAIAFFAIAVALAHAPFWVPLALAGPLGLLQLYFDARLRGRELLAELTGAVALGATVSMIALAAGWPHASALALWLIMAVRATASVLYVRARLRLDRGLAAPTTATWAFHVLSFGVVTTMALAGWAPWLAVAAFGALLLRAAQGLSASRRPVRPQIVGFREMGYGLLTVLLVGLGYLLRGAR
jgi:hypothetical protein